MALDEEAVAAALPLYEVEGELGHGAWGVVLAGRHRQLGRDVAIKQLPRSFGADPAVRSRFIAEARLLASLDHPHVVPLYDFVEHEGLCLLVMERLTGGTLWSRSRAGNFAPQSSCALILATLSALHYAHQRGVLHRDVKPENLMFSGRGDLKVTDFGIAKVVGGAATVATRAGDVLGTPAYMAPEQAMGQELSPATDVYAVGTVLYELLSGTLPFPEDSNPMAMLYRHVHEDPAPLLDIAPNVPFKLAEVTQQSLARDPAARYHDAEEFSVALADAACRTWGPGWLPASGMAVSTSGPVLSAATGQSRPPAAETLLPRHDTPRETPVSQELAASELVPVSSLIPEEALTPRSLKPPASVEPPPAAAPVSAAAATPETQAVAHVPPPSEPPTPVGGPPSEPPGRLPSLEPTPAHRRSPWLFAVPVALALIIAVVVALLLSGGSNKTVHTQAAAALDPGQWAAVQSAPTPRQELASAVNDGVVWVLGGLNGSDSTAKVEGYDPAANAWRAGPDLPLPLHHEMAATLKGEIVVAGGWVPEGGVLNAKVSDQVFALRAGKWVALPHLNHPRAAGAAAVAGDKLVVFGGQAEGKLVPQTEVFDGTKWSDGPDLPTPRDHLAAASDGTYVYAVGGRFLKADNNVGALERYDASAKKWTKLPDMPTPRGDLGAAVVGGRLVAVGGEGPTQVFPTAESFDIGKGEWSSLPPMRTPRHGIAVATVGTSVYAIAGAQVPSHGVATNIAEVLPFTPATNTSSQAAAPNPSSPWRAVHVAPTARQDVASTVDDGVVWVLGGSTGPTSATAKVEGYDPAIDTWKSGPDLPLPLSNAMAVTYNGEIFVMGGWIPAGGNLTAQTSNRVFALEGNAWVEKPPMTAARAAGAAAVVGNQLVVVGGEANGQLLDSSEIFDGTQWVRAPGMPTPRDHLAAVADDHFVYAIGGRALTGDKNLSAFERFEPATGKWTKGPSLAAGRSGLGAAIVGGKVYAVGGEDRVQVLGTVEAFDLATGTAWLPAPSMSGRYGLAVQAVGPSLYAIDGGRQLGATEPSKVAEVFRP